MNGIWKAFNVLEEGVMASGMVIMVVLNFLNVICRYLLPQTPFSYTEELVVLIFVWISMFGISYGYRKSSHTVLTLLSDVLPGRFQPAVIVFSAAASALLMCLLAKTGYSMMMNQVKFGQILPGMKLPMYIVGAAIPIGAAVAFVSILRSGCGDFSRTMKSLKDNEMTGNAL
ncbi:MAG: TRAP transporter small permease [Synergistaceae bacterium]|jgi:TRAP-type C4-dicarboxylate transport system permease small subunit|nr:TRAP transporter small permease [Synergistaceae bacterium]